MTLAAAIAVIAAAIAPFITALFARKDLTPTQKRIVAGVVAIVLGTLVAIATGQITGVPQSWIDWLSWVLVSIGLVISLAQGFYRAWKGTLEKVEGSKPPEQPEIPV